MTPARGKLFVRYIETTETLPSGKVILTPKTREALASHQVEVVSIGEPSHCEDADCERQHGLELHKPRDSACHSHLYHRCEAKTGDWVLVRHRSLSPTHEDDLYCCHQDDVLAVLQS